MPKKLWRVICATPTGSTAYSYSAGGPVLFPSVEALVITPICQQLCSSRSLVVPSGAEVEFTVDSEYGAIVAVDGRSAMNLNQGDRIRVNQSALTTRIVQMEPISSRRLMLMPRQEGVEENRGLVYNGGSLYKYSISSIILFTN